MKILFIHCAYQIQGGEDAVVQEEIKLLQQAGHTVQLLSFANEGCTFLKLLQAPFNLSSYRKTRSAIRGFAPNAVHLHNLHFAASPSVIYAAKHGGVPIICTLHNYRLLCPSATLFYDQKIFLDSLYCAFPWKAVRLGVYKNSMLLTFWLAAATQLHHWLGTWSLPERFIVLTRHAETVFLQAKKKFRKEQFVVKPNFSSRLTAPLQKRDDRFLFVGRLSEEKGISLLLQQFAGSSHRLVIAGDGPLKETVLEATKKHPNISYAGRLQKPALTNLMQTASALVFPSIWYEGMPLTIIEAFACGLPVIASKLGAMESMISHGHNGLLFEAGEEKSLNAALEKWAALSANAKASYSANASSTYEAHYLPEKNIQLLLAIYQSVLPANEKKLSLTFAA